MKEDYFFKKAERNFSLKEYNTMRIDCTTDFFLKAENREDVVEAVKYTTENKVPLLVLGKGSNVVLPPFYKGVVLFIGMEDIETIEKEDKIVVSADSGAYLPDVAFKTTEKKGKGMEWAGGVPGTVGGAVRGNAGAFDSFMADCVEKVTALNKETLEKDDFSNKECEFGYRESIFKKGRKHIILKVEMRFPKGENGLQKVEEYLEYRKENHPIDPSAGSIFKNPTVDEEFYSRFPETEKFKKMGFVPVRFLIESCGLSGEKEGGAQISKKHANFIVNAGNATGEDVKKLINLVKEKVKEKYGLYLKEEVEIV